MNLYCRNGKIAYKKKKAINEWSTIFCFILNSFSVTKLFVSCLKPFVFQSEVRHKAFHKKKTFHLHTNETHFHTYEDFAATLMIIRNSYFKVRLVELIKIHIMEYKIGTPFMTKVYQQEEFVI